ncbi:MAG: gamma-glutamyl-gamma-aminobutyrate hydrolase family protein [Caldilineaceae bacterium]
MAPLIGITTYGRNDYNAYTLPAEYVDAVRRAGGIPVLIPPGEAQTAELMTRLDGLILSGGPDVDPELYDGMQHKMIYGIDPDRDETEIALAQIVAEHSQPTLCICRGAQVMNVALGGSLVEHLPDVVGEEVVHRDVRSMWAQHTVNIEEGTKLADILQTTSPNTYSWHHQSIRRPAPVLKVVARAEDGTIEAAEKGDHPFLLLVQWHPEASAMIDPVQQRLFNALVEAARKVRP